MVCITWHFFWSSVSLICSLLALLNVLRWQRRQCQLMDIVKTQLELFKRLNKGNDQ